MAISHSVARPPGPSPLSTLVKLATGNVGVTDFMVTLMRDYPQISHVHMGVEHVYALSSAELVREFFVTHPHEVHKAPALKNSNALLGNGLLTNEGESWKHQRKLVQPGFHMARIHAYAEQMTAVALAQNNRWRDGQQVDLAAEMSATTLAIVGQALFGEDFDADAFELAEALNNVMAASSRWLLPLGPLLGRIPTPANRRAARGSEKLQTAVQSLMEKRRRSGDTGDVLSMLLSAQGIDGQPLSDRQVQDEVMTIILAGHETTAMTLSWAWMMLHDSPDVAAKLRSEIDAVLTDRRAPNFDDVIRLPYAKAVIAESLRLYPPAWVMGRKVTTPIELGGFNIPSGSTVVVCPLAMHRDARYWRDPEAFDPERWLTANGTFDDEAPGQPSGAWLPFGLGLRKCVGQAFAWTESVIVLSVLAQNWEPEVKIERPLQLTPAITLRPRNGMPAVLRKR